MSNSVDIEKLVRPNIRELSPYHSAREDFSEGTLLDANENSLGTPFNENHKLHRYPDPNQNTLRELIAEWRGVRKQNVFTGVGSDEGIDLLLRIFCRPGKDRILTVPPTYGMYKVAAQINEIDVDNVILDENFQPKVDEILDAVTPNTKLLFLCSPNNPTGNSFDADKITRLVEEFAGIVVLDEAYIDFSNRDSWAPKIADYPNLVILQTMSKSLGLAGIRLGITLAPEGIIKYMMSVKAPYNVNRLTSEKAIEGLQNLDTVQFHVEAIKKERKKLRDQLNELSAVKKVYASDANFLLAKTENAKVIYQKLIERDIIVRYRGDEPLCDNCLRITVGTPDENAQLISALKELTS